MDELTRRLVAWAAAAVAPTPVVLGPPRDGPGAGVSVHLLDWRPAPAGRTPRPPLRAVVRYLLTPWAERADDLPAVLDRLAFAALAQTEFEPEPPPPAELWAAFGLTPRPAVLLGGVAVREREYPTPPLVREPLAVDLNPVVPSPREG